MIQKAIEVFNIVRDIPYHIPLTAEEQNNTCHTKAKLLHELLSAYRYTARIRVCSFLWKETVPEKFHHLIKQEQEYHSFVEMLINDKWIVLDASFDRSLKKLSVPVNEWDGKADTKIAVKVKEILAPNKAEKICKEYCDPLQMQKSCHKNKELYEALNQIYEQTRKKEENNH